MVLVVRIVVIASMQTLRGVIMLRGSVFVTLDGEVRYINVVCVILQYRSLYSRSITKHILFF